jgi:hypothetical protein
MIDVGNSVSKFYSLHKMQLGRGGGGHYSEEFLLRLLIHHYPTPFLRHHDNSKARNNY